MWAAGAAEPTYAPVAGALVSGVDVQGQPLWALAPGGPGPNVAVTQADGTYALWDWAFAGGAVTVSATVGGQTQTATAYEVAAPDLTRSPGLRFTRTVAHATVVLPPTAPTTPVPLLGVSVLAETATGLTETNRLVTVGTPLRVRVRDDRAAAAQATSDLTVQGVTIGGEARSATRQADGTVLSDAPWTPTQVGAVTVTATALAPGGGVLTASVTLRVLAAGGSVNEPLPNDPPAVITALTLPKAGGDQALKMDVNGLWWRGQVHEKPLASRPTLFWADLHYLNDIDKAVWRADALLDTRPLDVDAPLDQIAAARRNRRWAELAFYFRAMARPAGAGPVDALGPERNRDATAAGGSGGLATLYDSHSYMTVYPVSRVWSVYEWLTRSMNR